MNYSSFYVYLQNEKVFIVSLSHCVVFLLPSIVMRLVLM